MDLFANSLRVSAAVAVVYLARAFGGDFSQLLILGSTPFGGVPSMPSRNTIESSPGGKPKCAVCQVFNHDPRVVGVVAGRIGLLPESFDQGTRTSD